MALPTTPTFRAAKFKVAPASAVVTVRGKFGVAEIAAAGYPVPVPPRVLRPGVRVAQIEDGEGNALELMQHDA